jgi:hypothetical protein
MAGHAINSRLVRFINMSNNTLKSLFAEILPQHIESQEVLQKRQQRLRKKILESNSPFATELASLMG